MALWHHSDKNSAGRNNCYLDFVQTRGLISFVIDNHLGDNLKENLVYGIFGSIVNNRRKKWLNNYWVYPVPLYMQNIFG